jgi:hypothetical protein
MRFVMKSGAARVLGGLEGWVFGVVGECVLMLWTGASSACWMWWPTGLTSIRLVCRSVPPDLRLHVCELLLVGGAAGERTSGPSSRREDVASFLDSPASILGFSTSIELGDARGASSIALFYFRVHGTP